MAGKNTAAFGIYNDRKEALNEAVDALKAAGYRNTDISVLFPETDQGPRTLPTKSIPKSPEGAAAGAGTGASRRRYF